MPKRNETLKFSTAFQGTAGGITASDLYIPIRHGASWIANGRNEDYGSWIKLSNETYNLDPSRNDITTDPNFNIK